MSKDKSSYHPLGLPNNFQEIIHIHSLICSLTHAHTPHTHTLTPHTHTHTPHTHTPHTHTHSLRNTHTQAHSHTLTCSTHTQSKRIVKRLRSGEEGKIELEEGEVTFELLPRS